jgi:hypothetical protein
MYNKGLQCNYIVNIKALQFSRLICVPEDGSGEPKHVVTEINMYDNNCCVLPE